LSNDGGFDIKNIPPEWKQIYQKAGIKKKDLENNPELAREVINVMNQAQDEAQEHGGQINLTQEVKVSTTAPPAPPMMGKTPQLPPSGGMKTPAPTPSGGIKISPPKTEGGAPPQQEETQRPISTGDDGGGRGDLLQQIREGKNLHKVVVNENRESNTGNTLLSTLQNALQNHRKDIEGDDEGDDWSNEGWDEEDDD